MSIVFHCCTKVQRSGKKSKHRVLETCEDVRKVLRMFPTYGVVIPRHNTLRKMRIAVPGLNVGKSGGYRLIYRVEEMDAVLHIVFLETYFKGDMEDLTDASYKQLESVASDIFSNPMIHEWSDPEEMEKVEGAE